MATIAISSVPSKVVEAEAVPVENILSITDPGEFANPKAKKEYNILVTVGTFQFAAGAAIGASNPSYTVNGEVRITLSGLKQLRFKAAAQNDAFEIST